MELGIRPRIVGNRKVTHRVHFLAHAVLAVATIGLGIATVGLYLTGEKQIGLLHKQFIATHRPKVVVRFVQGPTKVHEDGLLRAWVTFANTGPTEATILALGYDLGLRQGDGWIGGLDAEPKLVTPFSLQSGDRHTVEIKERENEDLNSNIGFLWEMWRQPAVARSGSQPELCVVGEVRYRDGNGVVRHTGFLRVHDPENGKWSPDTISNGDYED